MEANFFRCLASELDHELTGRRIDQIYAPTPKVWALKLQSRGSKPLHLLFRPAKSAGHLFLSSIRPINPLTAPAMAMWFRKRVKNRKIIALHSDWPGLRLALELTPRSTPDCETYLILDCRSGMKLVDVLDGDFDQQPDWPAIEDILEDKEIWREYPHISPPLRKALANLPQEDALNLYFNVASGSANTFYLPKTNSGWSPPLAWPSGRHEEEFHCAIAAANAFGERTLFPLIEMEEEKTELTSIKRARKRFKRNMDSLNKEEIRLQELAAEQIKAEAIQAELYKFKHEEGLEEVTVTHPKHGTLKVPLNPHMSPTENMEKYFELAAKAQRGFPHIKRRRKELLDQLKRLNNGNAKDFQQTTGQATQPSHRTPLLPNRYKGLAVALFRSSDGFLIIRGKNKLANHAMLSKAASSFDYWLHLADGPSSHVIIKRDHPGHEVPETTLTEAAILCGLKSYRGHDQKADIMYALVKDVRKIKGLSHGQVAVNKRIGTLRVNLDPLLEESLG